MFDKVLFYIRYRYMKTKALFMIKRFEKQIDKGWKKNLLIIDQEDRINHGLRLLEAEAKLRHLKMMYKNC